MENKIDYKKIGLKSGLEIHQQLDTKKLFCNCPSLLRQEEPDFEISRKLHIVAGESGEIDTAAIHEAKQDKEFIYQGYDTTCLVELDEEPPHIINQDALKIALQISLLLNCKIIPITQIMRKTVIDGSNTSGFQRTVMIARDGYVETSLGRVGIDGIFLEEDSARAVKKDEKIRIFKLDRLGIPLIEIATAPDIKTPEQAKEVALHIGDILRSCKVKRGIGTIRQDVNISIKGSNRVELKGFQDPKIMIKTVENEIERQLELIKKTGVHHRRTSKHFSEKCLLEAKNPSEVRRVLADGTSEFLRPMPGSARMYPETDVPLLKISRDFINNAKKTLPKLRSEDKEDLKKLGLNQEMIKLLFKQNKLEEFRELLKIINKPQLITKILLIFPKEIASRKKVTLKKVDMKLEDNFSSILSLVKNKKLFENQIKEVMEKIVDGIDFEKAIIYEKEDLNVIEEKIRKIIKDKQGLNPNAYMGLVMNEFKGKIDGKSAMEIILKYVK